MLKLKFLPIIILPFLLTGFASGQELEKVLTAKTFTNSRGENLPYRLFMPANYDRRKKYPLIVFLHGSGGLGNDNLKQLQLGNLYLIDRFTQSESQSRYPAFVVAPQSIGEGWVAANDRITPSRQLSLAVELIDELRRTYSIDSGRLYVAGQSLGGFGTFAIISAYPRMFAAGIPLCGGGDESKAAQYKGTALWVFHGEKDESVPVANSRQMVAAIKKAGGQVKYTEYPGEGHSIWTIVAKEPDLLQWLFSQHR
ncbi:MAG TPA: prolyl oligopeptidase family serine peptidase [Pyrinomonadaceae bacterium]